MLEQTVNGETRRSIFAMSAQCPDLLVFAYDGRLMRRPLMEVPDACVVPSANTAVCSVDVAYWTMVQMTLDP